MQLDLGLSSQKTKPEPEGPQIYSVAEVTSEIRQLLEQRIGEVWVEGEVSNFRRQASGHCYFTLKDEEAQLSCVLFAGAARSLGNLQIADGKLLQVFGAVSVYAPRGQYQMVIRQVRDQGAGALQARFEQLKSKLQAEGLFSSDRKKKLPAFPRRIAVITSPTGAALQDFLHVLWRRSPATGVLLFPVRVQGDGAAGEIREALVSIDRLPQYGIEPVDLVVLTRGGGSIEDLWEFNDESLARAIAACPLPVVSAVGHEIDFTIADFVADLRAPTPSAAAEILSVNSSDLAERLRIGFARMKNITASALAARSARLQGALRSSGLREPLRKLQDLQQRLDDQLKQIDSLALRKLQDEKTRCQRGQQVLQARHPGRVLCFAKEQLNDRSAKLHSLSRSAVVSCRQELRRRIELLAALSPQRILHRGFALALDETGQAVTTAGQAAGRDILLLRFADGELRARPQKDSLRPWVK